MIRICKPYKIDFENSIRAKIITKVTSSLGKRFDFMIKKKYFFIIVLRSLFHTKSITNKDGSKLIQHLRINTCFFHRL